MGNGFLNQKGHTMKERKSYIQQNLSMKEEEHKELALLMVAGWRAVDILRLGMREAKKISPMRLKTVDNESKP